jgi:group II intron reverse transcriptase/maturase
MKELMEYTRQGWGMWIVEADIVGFFDNISHKLIYDMVAVEVADRKMLALLKKFLQAGVMEGTKIKQTRKGTPQGGVISPLLANIVLNHLDWTLHDHGFKFVRYADDFAVVCRSKQEAEKALELIRRVIEEDLNLQLHPEKTRVVRVKEGFDFLGFAINSLTVRMGKKAEDRFKNKIRESTTRHHNLDTEAIKRVNVIIREL